MIVFGFGGIFEDQAMSKLASYCFVGGVGRSGTSFTYRCLTKSPEFVGIPEAESKFLVEPYGLIDLYINYVETYTPNRFQKSCSAFAKFFEKRWSEILNETSEEFRATGEEMDSGTLVQEFISQLYSVQTYANEREYNFAKSVDKFFRRIVGMNELNGECVIAEKTPHNFILFHKLKRIFPNSKLLHVIRDPRAIAESLVRQSWGPGDYRTSVMWVKGILQTYEELRRTNVIQGADVIDFRLEDMVSRHKEMANEFKYFIGIGNGTIDFKASKATLSSWRAHISDEDFLFATKKMARELEMYQYPISEYSISELRSFVCPF